MKGHFAKAIVHMGSILFSVPAGNLGIPLGIAGIFSTLYK